MSDAGRLYVQFSPELRNELGDDLMPLREILDQAGVDAETEWRALPPTNPGERTKALVETVLVGAASAVAFGVMVKKIEEAITEYLDHKAVRATVHHYYVNEPVIGKDGKPVEDENGSVQTVRRRIGGFDPFPTMPREGLTLVVGEQGLEFRSGDQPGGPVVKGGPSDQ